MALCITNSKRISPRITGNRHPRGRYALLIAMLALLIVLPSYACLAQAKTAAQPSIPPVSAQQNNQLSAMNASILGIVEGLTEYLPISSTGHMLLAQHLLNICTSGDSKVAMDNYEIVIQAGAILAVLFLYWGRVRKMFLGLIGKDLAGRRLLINTIVGVIPAAVIGIPLEKVIKHYLFGMWPVVVAWLIGGVIILIVANRQRAKWEAGTGKQVEDLTIPQVLVIGGIQIFAMWPGVSRSLSTILGGLLVGLCPAAAVEFSFLLGLVTLQALRRCLTA